MEWVSARYGQIVPTNWSMVQYVQFMNPFIPLRYSVADAQNVITQTAIEKDFKWVLLIEHDTCPPVDAFIRFNDYIRSAKYPVVSGLYYTRSQPAEPMAYRGRGNSYFSDWKLGDKVWVDGVPTGMLLINVDLLKAMWDDSPEYMAGDVKCRRVFETPNRVWFDEASGSFNTLTGTSDMEWCTRVIEGGYLKKAGWPELQRKKYPFLIDTKIACVHIDQDGTQYPYAGFRYDPNLAKKATKKVK